MILPPHIMNLSKSIITLFAIAFLSHGETLKINPADDLYTAAQISLSQAQQAPTPAKAKVEFESAETWFKKFLESFPTDKRAADATYFLAVSQSQIDKVELANANYRRYLAYQLTGKMAGTAALQLALTSYNEKDYAQAVNYLDIATANLPPGKSRTLSHYTRAICLQKSPESQGDMRNDLLYVLSKEDGKPYYEKSHFLLAGEYLKEKLYLDAYKLFQQSIKSKDAQIRSQSLHKCALLSQKLNEPEAAFKYNQLVLKNKSLKPYHPSAALYLMNVAAQKQDWKKVISYKKYGESSLSDELKTKRSLMIGQAHIGLGETEKASPFMKHVVENATGTPLAFDAQYLLLSRSEPKSLDRKAASDFLSLYSVTHDNDPRLQNIKLLIAEHDFLEKRYSEALTSYNELQPELLSDENLPTIGFRLIMCYLKLEKPASPLIDQFVQKYPDDPRSPYLLFEQVTQLIKAEKNAEAISTLERVLTFNNLESDLRQPAELQLAKLFIKTNNYEKAEAAYRHVFKTHKANKTQNASWLFWMGYSQYQQKNYSQASQNFKSARKFNAKEKAQELSKLLALSSYNLKELAPLEEELKYHQKTFKTLLPASLYLYVALEHYKQSAYTKAWWGFERAIIPENLVSYEELNPEILIAYCKSAIATKHYAPAQKITNSLKSKELAPYDKALNFYHCALATYELEGAHNAQADIDEGMRLNPAGDLKYQLLLLAGKAEIDLGEIENGTRLLKQVILLSPKNQNSLKVTALDKLINHSRNNPTPENQKLLEEYKKELEKLR